MQTGQLSSCSQECTPGFEQWQACAALLRGFDRCLVPGQSPRAISEPQRKHPATSIELPGFDHRTGEAERPLMLTLAALAASCDNKPSACSGTRDKQPNTQYRENDQMPMLQGALNYQTGKKALMKAAPGLRCPRKTRGGSPVRAATEGRDGWPGRDLTLLFDCKGHGSG